MSSCNTKHNLLDHWLKEISNLVTTGAFINHIFIYIRLWKWDAAVTNMGQTKCILVNSVHHTQTVLPLSLSCVNLTWIYFVYTQHIMVVQKLFNPIVQPCFVTVASFRHLIQHWVKKKALICAKTYQMSLWIASKFKSSVKTKYLRTYLGFAANISLILTYHISFTLFWDNIRSLVKNQS